MTNKMEIHYPAFTVGQHQPISSRLLRSTRTPPDVSWTHIKKNQYYTLIMHDPDAVGGNKIHWLVYNLPHQGIEWLPYAPPNPPPRTGTHRYIFWLVVQPQRIVNHHRLPMLPQRFMSIDDALHDIGIFPKKVCDSRSFVFAS